MDKETEAYLAGSRGEAHSSTTIGEILAHERGQNSRSGGGGGVPIFLLPALMVLLACLWPLVAAGTLLGAGIGLFLLEWVYPQHGELAIVFVALVAGGAGLYGTFKVERVLQRSALYRVLRRIVRLILFTALFVYIAVHSGHGVLNPLYVPEQITLRWLDSQLSPKAYVITFVLLIVVHLVSNRLDLKVAAWTEARRSLRASPHATDKDVDALASQIIENSKEQARARWARRRKWGSIFGGVGAIFLASIGEAFGSIVFGFFFFGLIGALLSRFLIRKRKQEPKASSPA